MHARKTTLLTVLPLGLVTFMFTDLAFGAAFTIDDWSIGTSLIDPDSHESVGSNSPENPFQAIQSLTINNGTSSAQTDHDLSWTDNSGTFQMGVGHVAQDAPINSYLYAASSGGIYVTPLQPILLTIGGVYDYNAPASGFTTSLSIVVTRLQEPSDSILMVQSLSGGPGHYKPSVGTLTINDEHVSLTPGFQYEIYYSAKLRTSGSNTGVISTADGNVHFTLRAIPEPSTVALFCLALGTRLLRRARRI